ncbi:hypothetical protein [Halobacteriovorax sp. HLS]|uniref:hypothetical protein n=1 Tax=Halobacteriovorax sp. HLS TaxID=2234000 RepID=UPI000FDC5593|nr:hypothetical protein [Halobacteriovorax sp. HLS]
MKLVLGLLLFSFSSFGSGGGVGGSAGGGGVKPIKDERARNINIGSSTGIVLGGALTKYENVSNSFSNSQSSLSISLDKVEEVTLQDGTVLSKEELLEFYFNQLKK